MTYKLFETKITVKIILMKIGIIQASSQKGLNQLIYNCTKEIVDKYGHEVINFGCFKEESEEYSYIDIAIEISLLLSSESVDFIITGCSSGQGMMLACNSLPSVLCGFVQTPQDAFLFGRINGGNSISLPLGLNFSWCCEVSLKCIIDQLFEGPFGCGYPEKDKERKVKDTVMLKKLNSLTKKSMIEIFDQIDEDLLNRSLKRKNVVDYILKHGKNKDIIKLIKSHLSKI